MGRERKGSGVYHPPFHLPPQALSAQIGVAAAPSASELLASLQKCACFADTSKARKLSRLHEVPSVPVTSAKLSG